MTTRPQRYCGMCDKWVPANETVCKACGADTDRMPTKPLKRTGERRFKRTFGGYRA